MRRIIPLFAAVLALALSSTAAADTFRVVQPHKSDRTSAVAFTKGANSPMSFGALRPIWQAAGGTYGIPWQVLAAINKVETDFGRNLGPSSAGAVGWMQFMPSTWARWGIDANGDGVADPNNPTDAIFSAARYLAGCGGQFDIARSVYCYNHANWYVNEVLGLAALYGESGGTGLYSVDFPQTSLPTIRRQIAASHAKLGATSVHARKLHRTERQFLRIAATAHLLSDQLEAHKHAVLIGVQRHRAEARAAQLRQHLDAATAELDRMKNANGAPFATGASQLLSSDLFSIGGGSISSGAYSGVVSIAAQYLGIPYVWGGASPSGFDCSGLVQYVFAQVGVSLPHYTVSQWNYPGAVPVAPNELQPGDLVFFNGVDHVGIYAGDGYFIDAPHTGANVRVDSLSEPWYATKYDGARRIVGTSLAGVPQASSPTAFTTGNTAQNGTTFTSNVIYFTH